MYTIGVIFALWFYPPGQAPQVSAYFTTQQECDTVKTVFARQGHVYSLCIPSHYVLTSK